LIPQRRVLSVTDWYDCAVQVIVVTGISGSGKSVALAALEDLGFFCVDNLPARLLPDLIQLQEARSTQRVAVAIDSRSGSDSDEVARQLRALGPLVADMRVVFLTANTPTLIARFSETRRRHPLDTPEVALSLGLPPHSDRPLFECIELERELLAPLAELGLVLDTSDLKASTLRHWLKDLAVTMGLQEGAQVLLTFESFAFKQGVPSDADLVFDVRCLPNPFYDPVLRPLTGLDRPVADFLASAPGVTNMVDDIANFVTKWLPAYARDGRNYLTVAIGCTGGQHRSVHVAEQVAARFGTGTRTLLRHRALSVGQAGASRSA
jgi:UPF0042 nucleotide-binding protein